VTRKVLSLLLILAGGALPGQAEERPSSKGKLVSPALPDTSTIEGKLDAIQLEEINLQRVPFREAVGKLHQAAAKADQGESPGVNMIISLATDETQDLSITAVLPKGSLRQALTALAAAAKLKIAVSSYAVSFVSAEAFTDPLVTKEYGLPGPPHHPS
jgi:hypothetical protein